MIMKQMIQHLRHRTRPVSKITYWEGTIELPHWHEVQHPGKEVAKMEARTIRSLLLRIEYPPIDHHLLQSVRIQRTILEAQPKRVMRSIFFKTKYLLLIWLLHWFTNRVNTLTHHIGYYRNNTTKKSHNVPNISYSKELHVFQ